MKQVKTILLTGASSGIGLEMAKMLATQNHRLILVSRSNERLEAIAADLAKKTSAEILVHALDLSMPQAAQQLVSYCDAQQFDIDILINNAGFGILEEHVKIAPEKLRQMLQLNVVTVAELCQAFGARMKQRRAGTILNVASTAGFQATPYFAAYGASKAFVLCLSEAIAKELEDAGVRVCCLAPGPTDTAFFDAIKPQQIDEGHYFKKAGRTNVRSVAEAGVALLTHGGTTRVVGLANQIMIFGNRFAPRSVVAAISKRLLKPVNIT
ncbi:MAG: putative ketoacyl reductase [Pseudomonadota bacterium]